MVIHQLLVPSLTVDRGLLEGGLECHHVKHIINVDHLPVRAVTAPEGVLGRELPQRDSPVGSRWGHPQMATASVAVSSSGSDSPCSLISSTSEVKQYRTLLTVGRLT